MAYKLHHYKSPTDDDIKRHLRPIRAEYVRKVRELTKGKKDNDGCFKKLLGFCLVVILIILLT